MRNITMSLLWGALFLSPSAFAQEDTTVIKTDAATFGQALDVLDRVVNWSGYGDTLATYEFDSNPTDGVDNSKFGFDAYHINPILGARLSDQTWAEFELEIEHGGEFKLEYALLDYTVSEALNVRIGKFIVPIGEFNDSLHPSFRWTQISRPAMFKTVIPDVWPDVGLQLFGGFELGFANVQYNAYAVNGLGGTADWTSEKALRSLRGSNNELDNNRDKGLGGRVRVHALRGMSGDTSVSVSGYTGAVDNDESIRWSATDVALYSQFGKFKIQAEAAQSYLSDSNNVLNNGLYKKDGTTTSPNGDPAYCRDNPTNCYMPTQGWENGFYIYPHYKTGPWVTGVRYDYVTTGFRVGADGGLTSTVTHQYLVPSLMYSVSTFWNVRVEANVGVGATAKPTKLSVQSAYFF